MNIAGISSGWNRTEESGGDDMVDYDRSVKFLLNWNCRLLEKKELLILPYAFD
jgi:hypothetical protein